MRQAQAQTPVGLPSSIRRVLGLSLRSSLYVLMTLALTVLGYLLSAELCMHFPRFREFPNTGPIRIYVQSNGVHTDLVLPAQSPALDWRQIFPASDFPDAKLVESADWVTLGWGDEGFFLNTPSWQDLKLSTALTALSARAPSVLHVEYLSEASRSQSEMHALNIDMEQLKRLTAYVQNSVHVASSGRAQPLPQHYHQTDAFFRAKGHYSLVHTCNTWTGAALAEAQIQIGAWTPFARNVMGSLRAEKPAH